MQTQVYKQGGRQAAEWRAGQTRRQETSRNARKRENVQASRSRGRASLHEDDSPLIDCTREYSQPVPGGQAVFAPAADLADARVGPAYSEEVLDPDLRPRAGVPHARARPAAFSASAPCARTSGLRGRRAASPLTPGEPLRAPASV